MYGPFLSLYAKLQIYVPETLQHLMIVLDIIEDLSCVSEQTLTEISTFFLFFSSSYRLESILNALVGKYTIILPLRFVLFIGAKYELVFTI